MAGLVELPPGFVLDSTDSSAGALPPGFVLDADDSPVSKPTDENISKTESYLRGTGDMITSGFGDEIVGAISTIADPISRGIEKLAYGDNFIPKRTAAESYSRTKSEVESNTKAAAEANPKSFLAGQLTGAIAQGVGIAGTAQGARLANSLRTGSTAARIAKGAAAGAASGAAYGAGTAEEGKRLEGAGDGAVLGAVVGGAVPAVGAAISGVIKGGKNAAAGATARGIEQLDEAAATIRARSGRAYQAMREAGATFKPETSQNVVAAVEKKLSSDGILNPRLHDKALGLLDDLKQAAKSDDFGIEQLDQWRQLFGEVAGNFNDPVNARKARQAIDAIDDVVNGIDANSLKSGSEAAVKALKTGRSEYARARKFQDITDIVKKSDGDANYLKRELKKLLDNPKKVRGFNQEERAALKAASTTTAGEGVLKALGKFGFDLGNSRIGNTALPVGAALLGEPTLAVAGTAARLGQKAIARGKAENLLQVIEGTARTIPVSAGRGNAIPSAGALLGGTATGVRNIGESTAPKTIPHISITPGPEQYRQMGKPLPPQSQTEQEQQPDVQSIIIGASESAGVPAELMQSIAKVESSFNPKAKAKTSSAKGLFQITDKTWRSLVGKYGKEYGITEKDIMNPEANALMGALLTRDNIQSLAKRLDRVPSQGEVYIAHFLGDANAARLIKAQGKGFKAAAMFPSAAKANPSIFYAKGEPRSIEEVYALLGNKVA